MRVRSPTIEVPDETPFANDCLKREAFATALTSLTSAIDEGGTLSLEGAWGSGKTTFLRMWQSMLTTQGFQTISFSAWETDHTEDPMLSLLGEFKDQIESEDTPVWTARAKAGLKVLIKKGVPLAVRLGTGGLIDASAAIEGAATKLAEDLSEKAIEAYSQQKSAIASFRSALSELAAESGKPTIVLVDELDRCRPTYAIEMLERIKHLFGVKGVVFVLAIDREQLGHSIRSVYGQGMDTVGYLRRFIDLSCVLPSPNISQFTRVSAQRFGLDDELSSRLPSNQKMIDSTNRLLQLLFDIHLSSLRTVEQTVVELSVAVGSMPDNSDIYAHALIPLIFLRRSDPALLNRFLNRSIDAKALISTLENIPEFEALLRSREGSEIEFWLRLVTHDDGFSPFEDLEGDPEKSDVLKRAQELTWGYKDRLTQIRNALLLVGKLRK